MTTVTVLVFVLTGAIMLVAIAGGICLAQRILDPHELQPADRPERAADAVISSARHLG